jgi:hypothetical protein
MMSNYLNPGKASAILAPFEAALARRLGIRFSMSLEADGTLRVVREDGYHAAFSGDPDAVLRENRDEDGNLLPAEERARNALRRLAAFAVEATVEGHRGGCH